MDGSAAARHVRSRGPRERYSPSVEDQRPQLGGELGPDLLQRQVDQKICLAARTVVTVVTTMLVGLLQKLRQSSQTLCLHVEHSQTLCLHVRTGDVTLSTVPDAAVRTGDVNLQWNSLISGRDLLMIVGINGFQPRYPNSPSHNLIPSDTLYIEY